MIKGLEILKPRYSSISNQELPYPPLYKLFYTVYEIAKGKLKNPSVYLEQINQFAGIMEQRIDCEVDFVLYDFLSMDESKIFIENTYTDLSHLKEYYPIAECDSNKALMVGLTPEIADQIFIENTSRFSDGSRFKFIARNIFEFMPKVSLVELEKIGYGIKGYSSLYKNWGEDFWRVRKDKIA